MKIPTWPEVDKLRKDKANVKSVLMKDLLERERGFIMHGFKSYGFYTESYWAVPRPDRRALRLWRLPYLKGVDEKDAEASPPDNPSWSPGDFEYVSISELEPTTNDFGEVSL